MATTTFKLIKTTPFDTNGTKGIAYVVALNGRAMNCSTLSFADQPDAIKLDKDKLVINGDIEVVKRPYVNGLGETVQGLSIFPALGIALSDV